MMNGTMRELTRPEIVARKHGELSDDAKDLAQNIFSPVFYPHAWIAPYVELAEAGFITVDWDDYLDATQDTVAGPRIVPTSDGTLLKAQLEDSNG